MTIVSVTGNAIYADSALCVDSRSGVEDYSQLAQKLFVLPSKRAAFGSTGASLFDENLEAVIGALESVCDALAKGLSVEDYLTDLEYQVLNTEVRCIMMITKNHTLQIGAMMMSEDKMDKVLSDRRSQLLNKHRDPAEPQVPLPREARVFRRYPRHASLHIGSGSLQFAGILTIIPDPYAALCELARNTASVKGPFYYVNRYSLNDLEARHVHSS